MSNIFERVSVRKFKEKEVEQEKIDLLMKASMAAPSAGNQQPWEFYVVRDKGKIEKLSHASKYSGCAKNANIVIVPVYRKEGLKFPEYAPIDMSICCENMWLEATELGLGCVWLGIAPLEDRMKKVDEIIGLDNSLESFALMAIGYPDEEKEQQDRYEKERVHYL